MLQVLQKENLCAKYSKCQFGVHEIDYLGHTISAGGVHMEKEKARAVIE